MNIGILDPAGINNNPLTNEPCSDTYKKFGKIWSKLPAYAEAQDTIQKITNNNVILIISQTGSGKTVLVPKYTLHALNYNKKVAIILPKQLLTESASEYAALTLDVKLGEEVGFKHRGGNQYNKEKTKLLYTTDGTLVAMLKSDPLLLDFTAVIIDEAHERRVQTDFLLYLLKQICITRPEFKLIIMSATIDAKTFQNYFNKLKYVSLNYSGGTNYPITHIYNGKSSNKEYLKNGIKKINEILSTTKEGDIIFFVPSIGDTISSCKNINMNKSQNYCVELFSGVNHEQKLLATDKDLYITQNKGTRKIVIATNVAESSLTVDGIKYVIDSGYEIVSYFDPIKESKVLEKRLTTQSQIKQRCGRTGRTSAGTCYHMYDNNEYNKLIEFQVPGIRQSNITTECLILLTWANIQNIQKLKEVLQEFIEPPKPLYINYAINHLKKLNLIVNDTITPLGMMIATLPIEPMQGIAICAGWKLNCINEVVAIIVISDYIKNNINDLFNFNKNEKDKGKIKRYENARKSLMSKNSDHYTLYKIFKKYNKLETEPEKQKWVRDNFLKQKALNTINSNYKKLKHDCIQKLKKYYGDTPTTETFKKYKLKTRVCSALFKGYSSNMAVKNAKNNKYTHGIVSDAKLPTNTWVKSVDKVFYTEMMSNNGGSFLQIVSRVTKKNISLANKINI